MDRFPAPDNAGQHRSEGVYPAFRKAPHVLLRLEDMESLSQEQAISEMTEGKSNAGMGIADVTASGQRVGPGKDCCRYL